MGHITVPIVNALEKNNLLFIREFVLFEVINILTQGEIL